MQTSEACGMNTTFCWAGPQAAFVEAKHGPGGTAPEGAEVIGSGALPMARQGSKQLPELDASGGLVAASPGGPLPSPFAKPSVPRPEPKRVVGGTAQAEAAPRGTESLPMTRQGSNKSLERRGSGGQVPPSVPGGPPPFSSPFARPSLLQGTSKPSYGDFSEPNTPQSSLNPSKSISDNMGALSSGLLPYL